MSLPINKKILILASFGLAISIISVGIAASNYLKLSQSVPYSEEYQRISDIYWSEQAECDRKFGGSGQNWINCANNVQQWRDQKVAELNLKYGR